MKLLHIADLHLGRTLGEFELGEDQRFILNEILEICDKKKVDGILIAGDVFDKSVPSEGAVNTLDWFLNELTRREIKTFMISGNHDSDDRLNYGSNMFERSGVYLSAIYDGRLYKRTFTDEYGELDIYLLPFVKASQVKHFFPEEDIRTYEDAVRVILREAHINKNRRNILAAHQFVAGQKEVRLSGSETVTQIGLVERISYGCLDDFDYAALGHIHRAQEVGRETVRYAGSPLKYSLSETNNEKSVPLIDIRKKGEVSVELIPLKPLRDLRHIKGELRKLLSPENVSDVDDYIYVTLTDENVHDNAMGLFQQVYKNTVKLDYENSHTMQYEGIDIEAITAERSFDELINDFYRLVFDQDMSEEEKRILKEAAREAGVKDEAD